MEKFAYQIGPSTLGRLQKAYSKTMYAHAHNTTCNNVYPHTLYYHSQCDQHSRNNLSTLSHETSARLVCQITCNTTMMTIVSSCTQHTMKRIKHIIRYHNGSRSQCDKRHITIKMYVCRQFDIMHICVRHFCYIDV